MIRFVDLGKQLALDETDPEWPRQFAFYDTISDTFLNVGMNGHVWDSWLDILQFAGDEDSDLLDRPWALSPDWTKAGMHPDAAHRINAAFNLSPGQAENLGREIGEVLFRQKAGLMK